MGTQNDFNSFELSYPNDSLLNKIADIEQRLKNFTEKDTLGGFSTPRAINLSKALKVEPRKDTANRNKKGLIDVPLKYDPFFSYTTFRDTVIFDPAMLPVVFDGQILPKNLDFEKGDGFSLKDIPSEYLIDRDSLIAPELYKFDNENGDRFKLISKKDTYADELWEVDRRAQRRKQFYIKHLDRIKLNALAFNGAPITQPKVENKNPFQELITVENATAIARPDIEGHIIKQKFWKTSGEHNLQLSQKAYSENWNPKSDNSLNIQNYHKFNATYRKNKIEFKHWIEWRLNAQQTNLPKLEKDPDTGERPKDDRRSFLITDDWVKTYNRLGLDAFIEKWSYIVTLDLKTPIFNKYPQDKNAGVMSKIFSPLEGNFGIGAGYSLSKTFDKITGQGFTLSIDATPLSIDLKHVGSHKVYENNNYGIKHDDGLVKGDEGYRPKYTKLEFGSTINSTLNYKFNSFSNFSTRIKYFTNYERSYLECENTVNFRLNRFFAASLYVYMKYDDSIGPERKHDDYGYFSFNEVLGFGLSYTWN